MSNVPLCDGRHRSSDGRRLLAEIGEFNIEHVAEVNLTLWSGCDRDPRPIIEAHEVVWRYPGPGSDDPEEMKRTLGWFEPASIRDLAAVADRDDTLPRPEADLGPCATPGRHE
jgi:hypothetical protein